jgi:hypothetical protein
VSRGVAWCGVVWCGVVWHGVAWCGVVWRVACGVVWLGVACGVWRVVDWLPHGTLLSPLPCVFSPNSAATRAPAPLPTPHLRTMCVPCTICVSSDGGGQRPRVDTGEGAAPVVGDGDPRRVSAVASRSPLPASQPGGTRHLGPQPAIHPHGAPPHPTCLPCCSRVASGPSSPPPPTHTHRHSFLAH